MTVAVVTGAASGMGRACVERARSLADVVVAADLATPGIDGTIGVACDVSDPGAVAALAATVEHHAPFRALAHAAGISPTMADSRRIIEVDLVGTQLVLDAFTPLVGPGTAAVCFASLAAHQIAPFVDDAVEALLSDLISEPLSAAHLDRAAATYPDSGLAYAVAKVGVVRAAGRAATRWGPAGGRVVSLSPGLVDTTMGRQELAGQEAMREMVPHTPLGRMGRAEEVAAVTAFLLSEEASFLTGVDVRVDGGLHEALTRPPSPGPPAQPPT